MSLATDIIDHGAKAIAYRRELAELELTLKETKASYTLEAEGSNKEQREANVVLHLEGDPIHADIRNMRAAAESQELALDAIKAQIRLDLIPALGGNLTDDQAIHTHIERMDAGMAL